MLGLGVILTWIFFPVTSEVPRYPVLLGCLILITVAIDQSWEAFKRKGKAAIVDLPPTEGGHSTIHPYDIRMASGYDHETKTTHNFTVFALGGWMFGNMYFQGHGPFIVASPEYCEDTEAAFICHAKLVPVTYNEMPRCVKDELRKLEHFNRHTSKDLYIGAISLIDGSDTADNREKLDKFLDQSKRIDFLETQLTEVLDSKRKQYGFDTKNFVTKDELKKI